MLVSHNILSTGVTLLGLVVSVAAHAQDGAADLMSMNVSSLRSEIDERYDAALKMTLDPAVVAHDSNQFVWASQAKAQCGIAIGFLKSRIKDPVSVGKCADAYARMQVQTLVPSVPPTPTLAACNKGPFIVFFDWNRPDITAEASTILENAVGSYAACANAPIQVSGYADRSGTDAYNQALSEQRAETVRSYLTGHGVPDGAITTKGFGETNPRVPTADGVRELQNRRVEISFE